MADVEACTCRYSTSVTSYLRCAYTMDSASRSQRPVAYEPSMFAANPMKCPNVMPSPVPDSACPPNLKPQSKPQSKSKSKPTRLSIHVLDAPSSDTAICAWTFRAPYTDNAYIPTALCVALGPNVSVNMILGIELRLATQSFFISTLNCAFRLKRVAAPVGLPAGIAFDPARYFTRPTLRLSPRLPHADGSSSSSLAVPVASLVGSLWFLACPIHPTASSSLALGCSQPRPLPPPRLLNLRSLRQLNQRPPSLRRPSLCPMPMLS
jgi:hypothetical protein